MASCINRVTPSLLPTTLPTYFSNNSILVRDEVPAKCPGSLTLAMRVHNAQNCPFWRLNLWSSFIYTRFLYLFSTAFSYPLILLLHSSSLSSLSHPFLLPSSHLCSRFSSQPRHSPPTSPSLTCRMLILYAYHLFLSPLSVASRLLCPFPTCLSSLLTCHPFSSSQSFPFHPYPSFSFPKLPHIPFLPFQSVSLLTDFSFPARPSLPSLPFLPFPYLSFPFYSFAFSELPPSLTSSSFPRPLLNPIPLLLLVLSLSALPFPPPPTARSSSE